MRYKREITYKGVKFDTEFDFQPEEKTVKHYSDGSGYPGSPASINYIHIELCGIDFDEFFENEMDKIEEIIWKTFEE